MENKTQHKLEVHERLMGFSAGVLAGVLALDTNRALLESDLGVIKRRGGPAVVRSEIFLLRRCCQHKISHLCRHFQTTPERQLSISHNYFLSTLPSFDTAALNYRSFLFAETLNTLLHIFLLVSSSPNSKTSFHSTLRANLPSVCKQSRLTIW